ncbi:type IV pilin-like G/H family protein [Lusitaniella coriacea LEGE 07157]|uniref:Type IV pilin-like G/H family protein n=1 Tax=Lusitaniella coriacea LEGE 07157 TaxID=945747 RepID=A0A8J7J1V2_9CYAN|nr:type IV pilin-like G/H family protein [Lusitaniella coriacea]MBE9116014.1 type IV pilin-like G/H family protein [Lusitaniella coriacea LEGE 07157]
MLRQKKFLQNLEVPESKPRFFFPRRFFFKGLKLASGMAIGGILILRGINFLANMAFCGSDMPAKMSLMAMNSAQQSYFKDNRRFAANFDELDTGMRSETSHYRYSMQTKENAVFHYGISKIRKSGWEKLMGEKDPPNVASAVFMVSDENSTETITVAVRCIGKKPSLVQPPKPTLQNGVPTCPENFRNL